MVSAPTSRRRLLRVTGVAVGTALAGCIGSESTQQSNHDQTTNEAAQADDNQNATESSHHEEGGQQEEGSHHEEGGQQEESSHQDGGGHKHSSIGDPVEHATVKMVTKDGEYHFEPHVVRVKQGGTVTFVNESGSHSATAYHPDNDKPLRTPDGATSWDSGVLTEPDAEFDPTFETEGVYDYYCTPHESLGMVGSIIVGEPDAHDQPGLKPPQKSLPDASREKIMSLNERCKEALGHTHDG